MRFYSLFTAMLLSALAGGVLAQEKLIVTTGEYAHWTGENLPHGGFVNHVLTKAFKEAGYEVEFKYMPWKRAYKEAQEGRADASSFWFMSKERNRDFLLSDKVMEDPMLLFQSVERERIEWSEWSDLKGYTIGYTDGFTYPEDFQKAVDQGVINVQKARSEELNLEKLKLGRIDLFITGRMAFLDLGRKVLQEPVSELFRAAGEPIDTATGHLAITRKSATGQELRDALNQALKKLRQSGWYGAQERKVFKGYYTVNSQ